MLGRVVGQGVEQRRALAGGPAQHGVDEAVPRAPARLGELHRIGEDGVVGRTVQVEQLIQPEAKRREHRWVQPIRRALGETLDQVVERPLALHGAVGQAHRQRPVARVQSLRLGLQGLVGVGAALEHATQDRVGSAAPGSDRIPGRAGQRLSATRQSVAA